MTAADASVSELQIRTGLQDSRGLAYLYVNGVDILWRERPVRRPAGSLYPSGPKVFYPPDPVGLLPPDSSTLLPSFTPRQALIGICSCGEPGDASLWMHVRRENHLVVWEPDPGTPRSSIEGTCRFELLQYLEAVDEGHRSTMDWEPRPCLLARALRRQRDSLFGFSGLRLLDIRSWPGVDQLVVEVASRKGIQFYEVPVPDEQTDDEIVAELRSFDPSRYQRS